MPEFFQKVIEIWMAGGPLMIPLVLLCLIIFLSGSQLWSYFSARGYEKLEPKTWEEWIRNPAKGEGDVGEIIRYTQEEAESISDVQSRFTEVFNAKLPPVQRRIVFMNVLVAAAPLLGLLGTVLGMIATFDAIAIGGSELTEMMADGISQALITTEVGLLIAIPGFFLVHIVQRKKHEFEAFLTKLESFTVQHLKAKGKVA